MNTTCIRCGAPVEVHPSSLCTEAQLLHNAPVRSPLDGAVDAVVRQLRPRPAPAVVVTVYPGGSMAQTAREIRPILKRFASYAAPGDLAVCLHDPVNGDEGPVLDVVHDLGLRLWSAWGANSLVRTARAHGIAVAAAAAERWAQGAARAGAEVIEPNGERVGSLNANDWVPDAPGDAELLPELARAILGALRRAAPQAAISFTTHDHPRWHPVCWREWAGVDGVDLLALQYYAADPGSPGPEGHAAAVARLKSGTGQLRDFVARGIVRADLGPGGPGWTPYGQIHGLTTAGAAETLDAAAISRAWAIPTRDDEAGLLAVCAVLLARRETGRRANAIERWQAAHGLTPDGDVGPKTLAAMGLV